MANTTPIAGPAPSNPFSQISGALAPIYSMFGPASGGGGGGGTNYFGTNLAGAGFGGGAGNPTNAFGVTMSPNPNNPQNISTYASLANLLGTAAPAEMVGGGNLINMGTGVTGAGLGVTAGGLSMFKTPFDYLTKLAAGDPSTVASAAGPYANILSQQMNAATDAGAASMPQGGARAAFQAGMPQALASQVGNYELGLKPAAETGLEQMGTTIAGIGQGISGTGQQIAGTGTTMTGQAQQTMQNVIADALQKVALNYQYGGPQTFNTFAQAISSLLRGGGALAGGIGAALNSGGGGGDGGGGGSTYPGS